MGISVRHLAAIRAADPMMYETLTDIINGHDAAATQTNASSNGQTPTPPRINALTVQAKDGIFHASITDNGQIYRGINYHLQYSTDPQFSAPITVHLGPSRDYRGHIGNQTLYWRAYSDYPTSAHSQPVYHGGAQPLPVAGGGSQSGPTIPAGQGSGTGQPGQISGYGPVPYRGSAPPKR